ncbi:MAG: aminotransferase class V-fold PLP-dependent enzyme [Planctomycetes bacterium]|nr:aminotransferase class V-fold PLP-dependent enzyme [Planctomycetota bacterium]
MKEDHLVITLQNIRNAIVGIDKKIPLLNGTTRQYVNFDNAASTPVLKPVLDTVNQFLEWYSSIHRGTGWKSMLSTHIYEECRKILADFVGADPERDTVIFVKHTTEGINILSRRLRFPGGAVILTSMMEHHANDLPWRFCTCEDGRPVQVEHVHATEDGEYDIKDLEKKLQEYKGRVCLVAFTAASNVTGYINPIYEIAELCHKAGSIVFVDCAQFTAHHKIDMRPHDDPQHLDFISFSGHKMYAPFGGGALVGHRGDFEGGNPMLVGGGCVKMVSMDRIVWEQPPEKEEAGSPNVIGAVSLARSISVLEKLGMDNIAECERQLTTYAFKKMEQIPNLVFYGKKMSSDINRLGVIPFNIHGLDDFLTAAILAYEGGIGVRAGCFCAHPYVKFLLKVPQAQIEEFEEQVIRGNRSNLPGAVRISFGLYNTIDEIDYLCERLQRISRGEYSDSYVLDNESGMYHPKDFLANFDEFFRIG